MSQRRIDDHANWTGKAPSGQVFADGSKMKEERSADGEGGIMDYPDTTEDIRRDQMAGDAKIRSKPMKPGYRY